MITLEEGWQSYRQQCLPPTASQNQIDQLRCAFYAGGGIVLKNFEIISDPETTELESIGILTTLNRELIKFYEKLKIKIIMNSSTLKKKRPKL